MKRILHAVEAWMDDFKIKIDFYILYILCVLVPLIVTDSAVFSVVMKSEREASHGVAGEKLAQGDVLQHPVSPLLSASSSRSRASTV